MLQNISTFPFFISTTFYDWLGHYQFHNDFISFNSGIRNFFNTYLATESYRLNMTKVAVGIGALVDTLPPVFSWLISICVMLTFIGIVIRLFADLL